MAGRWLGRVDGSVGERLIRGRRASFAPPLNVVSNYPAVRLESDAVVTELFSFSLCFFFYYFGLFLVGRMWLWFASITFFFLFLLPQVFTRLFFFTRNLSGFTANHRLFMGFTEFYWVLLGFTGFYWVLLGFTGFCWVLLGFTGFYWVSQGFTGFHRILQGFAGFYRVLLGFTGFRWVSLGFTRFYWVLRGYTGFH